MAFGLRDLIKSGTSMLPQTGSNPYETENERLSRVAPGMVETKVNNANNPMSINVAPRNTLRVNSDTTKVNPLVQNIQDRSGIDYQATDVSSFLPDNDLMNTIGDQYASLIGGDNALMEQNERMATTALDRMGANIDQQTARQAAQMGIEPGSRQYNEIMEKNREGLVSQGSGILSNLAAQNLAQQERILANASAHERGQQQFGLDYAKTVENINRYGFEAGLVDDKQKSQWAEYVMSNPGIFSIDQVGEAKKAYFENMGIDISQLSTDPNMATQARNEIMDHVRVAHPEWTDEQIETESTRLFKMFSPYTSGAYETAIDAAGLGDTGVTDTDEPVVDTAGSYDPSFVDNTFKEFFEDPVTKFNEMNPFEEEPNLSVDSLVGPGVKVVKDLAESGVDLFGDFFGDLF